MAVYLDRQLHHTQLRFHVDGSVQGRDRRIQIQDVRQKQRPDSIQLNNRGKDLHFRWLQLTQPGLHLLQQPHRLHD